MNEHDKNFLKNMSPLLIAALVMFFMLVAFETKADDHNYTEHGIEITSEDLAVDKFYINRVKGWSWNRDNKVLTLTLINKHMIDVRFTGPCIDMSRADRIEFMPWMTVRYITVGDKIRPVFGYGGNLTGSLFPCYIKSITAVIPA